MTDDTAKQQLRALPSITVLLDSSRGAVLLESYGHADTADALRGALDMRRAQILAGHADDDALTAEAIVTAAEATLSETTQPLLRPVVNATGIILHTGLGRAVLPPVALTALAQLHGCCNVQMDLSTGERIRREACVRELVIRLTGAEDVLVVNNNAGATMLVLRALAAGREVVVSRGELIEIGGSFRLPDIMAESGATMREVGSTNKTHLRDYAQAIDAEQTALLFKAHKSNYQIIGFTKEVTIEELAALGKDHQVTVVDDLGCGAMVSLTDYGLGHEMTVRESLAAGADVVLFSTDKLIGGPQGGMIVGRKELLDRIRRHPMYRALRVGKMTLTALEATLRLFLAPEHLPRTHPTYAMLAKSLPDMERMAGVLAKAIQEQHPTWEVATVRENAHLGGGSLPGSHLPAAAVSITVPGLGAGTLATALRVGTPSVVSHTRDDGVLLNLRTVFESEIDSILTAIRKIHDK